MDEQFSQVGGVWIGGKAASRPYATLYGTQNALRISCFDEYVFPKDCITTLTKKNILISVGLCIGHTIPLYPRSIIFWVSAGPGGSRFALLKDKLNALGYAVE